MSKARFTPEQQEFLRNNQYTARVTSDTLSLTKEFKEIFYQEYITGAIPRDILQKYGYPVEILGKTRIWGLTHCIKKEYEHNGAFNDIHSKSTDKSMFPCTSEDKIRILEHQVSYLTQEVEFLKKFSRSRIPESRFSHHA